MRAAHPSRPQPVLGVFSASLIMVGLVVGIGIFRTPSIVAANVDSEAMFIGAWLLGGFITLIGALCYAELAAAYPHAGGEYHFLSRAYGRPVAMMFGWARCTVIQTGSIAAVAFMLGDYISALWPLGSMGPAIYAAAAVVLFTAINIAGTVQSKNLQVAVTLLVLVAMLAIVGFGLSNGGTGNAATSLAPRAEGAAFGLAMIFVLLTYGGWSEAAYLTGELKDARRNVAKVLVLGTLVLVTLYALTNYALLNAMGLQAMRGSDAVAADMMRKVAGPTGEKLVTLAIVVAALSTLNATIFTGARVFYVMARDMTVMRSVGEWDARGTTPKNGFIAQGVMALALIGMGAITRDGFKAMVDYTAPVFWSFLLLVAIALILLRRRDANRPASWQVPLYPLTPILFCLTCGYMLYASIAYTGVAGLIGLAVLLAGLPILLFRRKDVDAEAADARPATTDAAPPSPTGERP